MITIGEKTEIFIEKSSYSLELKKVIINDIAVSYSFFINNLLQWSSRDEYRYHQTLFALPMLFLEDNYKKDILVLGGGDGLGVRELLKFNDINSITLIDFSKELIFLAKNNEIFLELNQNSLNNKKVKTIIEDANSFIKKIDKKFDLIILNTLPPNNIQNHFFNNFYSSSFYKDLKHILKDNGIINIYATSSYLTPYTYSKIFLNFSIFESILPLNIDISSFGNTSFLLGKKDKELAWEIKREIPEWLFFDKESIEKIFLFFKDELPNNIDIKAVKKHNISQLVELDLSK